MYIGTNKPIGDGSFYTREDIRAMEKAGGITEQKAKDIADNEITKALGEDGEITQAIAEAISESVEEDGTVYDAIAGAIGDSVEEDGVVYDAIEDAIGESVEEDGIVYNAISDSIFEALGEDGIISTAIQEAVSGLQPTLTAGNGIDITDNVISVSYPDGDLLEYGTAVEE